MLPRAYLTVSRSDLPSCLAWPSGELLIGRSRVALLVGGKPRRIQVPSGNQAFTVVIYSIVPGGHEIPINIIVEDGGEYRLSIAFDDRTAQQQWVATDLHGVVWPQIEGHCLGYSVKNYFAV